MEACGNSQVVRLIKMNPFKKQWHASFQKNSQFRP